MGALDVDYPRLALLVLALATILGVGVAASTSGASFSVYNPAWDGASELRGVATDEGATVDVARSTADYDAVPANRTVAVVLSPDRAYGPREAARLRQFVSLGGTLVVAEDYGEHGNGLLAAMGVDARFVGTPLRDERHHGSSPAFPRATEVSNHTLTAGVDELTLNHGTALDPNGATVLVRSSPYGYLDENGNAELDDRERMGSYPVATVERIGRGRVVVVGDPSLFINAMFDAGDNAAFARALVADGDHVVLDYSHAGSLPPLAALQVAVRESPSLQLLVGFLAVGAVGLWVRRPGVSLPGVGRGDAAAEVTGATLAEADVVAFVRERHPDWDEARVRRVASTVITAGEVVDGND